jgi:hypothetical protein
MGVPNVSNRRIRELARFPNKSQNPTPNLSQDACRSTGSGCAGIADAVVSSGDEDRFFRPTVTRQEGPGLVNFAGCADSPDGNASVQAAKSNSCGLLMDSELRLVEL